MPLAAICSPLSYALDERPVELGQQEQLSRCHVGPIPDLYASLRCALKHSEWPLPTIYISDGGDDKNDGLSLKTAIYSLKRARNSMAAGMMLAGILGREHGGGSKRSFPVRKSANPRTSPVIIPRATAFAAPSGGVPPLKVAGRR